MKCNYVAIGEIASINSSLYSFKDNWESVIYLDTGSVVRNSISELKRFRPKFDKVPSRARRKVRNNSIVISMVRPNQEHFALLKNPPHNMLVSTGFSVIDADMEKVSPGFLYYALTTKAATNYFQSLAEQSVSTYPTLSVSDLSAYIIQLPAIITQRKIEKILVDLDSKISVNNQINDYLGELAQSIFNNWFVDFGPWGGEIPGDWESGVLGDYVSVKRGGSPRPIQEFLSDDGLRWLKIADVSGVTSPFIMTIKEHIKKEGLRKTVHLDAGSLVLSNSATPGIPKIISIDTCIHDGWLYFPESDFSNEWLYCYFQNVRKQLARMANGSVFQNLKTDIVKNFEIIRPTNKALDDFQEVIGPLFKFMEANQKEILHLGELRNALLPKLMAGEIDVSNVNPAQQNNHLS